MVYAWQDKLEKLDNFRWKIPQSYKPGMKVPGLIYASEKLLTGIINDKAPEQVANVAFLPGIVKYSLAMPDIHWGYGFSIGGVAATDPENGGVIAPGGIGYDICCGVRLVRSDLTLDELKPRLETLVNALFNNIPSGVGSSGDIKASAKEEEEIFLKGAAWAVKKGYGVKEDLDFTEDRGSIEGADPSGVSKRAYERGRDQSGTLGSGNHFLEVQVIDEIYDEEKADIFSLFKGQITMMIHSGSRGLGYQICDDYVKGMISCLDKYNINVPDRQLACAPLNSPEGKSYLRAMKCATNYAWTNRQCLMHLARNVFEKVFNKS
ncbi:MAG: RNA-splicing ligase RtcB, partial [Candidatus Omnitrophica bacterium CG12_big_fil_rev_8_21_14_0_65_42_8]